jgi:hypothetical protein
VQRVDAEHSDAPLYNEQERAQSQLETFVIQLNVACFVIGMFGTAFSIIGSEILHAYGREVATVQALKVITTASTVLLLVLLVLLYRAKLDAGKLRGDCDNADNLFSTGNLVPLVVECVLCVLHCPIGVSGTFQVSNLGMELTYTIDEAMSVATLLRVYLAARVLDQMVGLSGNQARIVAKWNKVNLGLGFSFRSMMENTPLQFVIAILVLVTFILAYALRVAERPVCEEWAHVLDRCGIYDDNYSHFTTALWNVIITMTTVGYGDIFPVSHAGRVVATLACFSGVVLVALLVTAITSIASFEPDERRAFNALNKAAGRSAFHGAAAVMIQSVWAYYRHRLRTIYGFDATLRFPVAKFMRKPTTVALDKDVRFIKTPGGGEKRIPNGYDVLLHAVHLWQKEKNRFWSLSREKNELGMLMTELLQSRTRLNEIAEGLSRQLVLSAAILPNIKAQLDLVSRRLDVQRLPLPRTVVPDPALVPGMAKFPAKLIYHASAPGHHAWGGTSDLDHPIAFMEHEASIATPQGKEYALALRSLPSLAVLPARSVEAASPAEPWPARLPPLVHGRLSPQADGDDSLADLQTHSLMVVESSHQLDPMLTPTRDMTSTASSSKACARAAGIGSSNAEPEDRTSTNVLEGPSEPCERSSTGSE